MNLYQKLLEPIKVKEGQAVAFSDWVDEKIYWESENFSLYNGDTVQGLELSLTYKIHSMISSEEYCNNKDEVLLEIKKRMAKSIHNEFYGDIMNELHELKSIISYGERTKALNKIDKIMGLINE